MSFSGGGKGVMPPPRVPRRPAVANRETDSGAISRGITRNHYDESPHQGSNQGNQVSDHCNQGSYQWNQGRRNLNHEVQDPSDPGRGQSRQVQGQSDPGRDRGGQCDEGGDRCQDRHQSRWNRGPPSNRWNGNDGEDFFEGASPRRVFRNNNDNDDDGEFNRHRQSTTPMDYERPKVGQRLDSRYTEGARDISATYSPACPQNGNRRFAPTSDDADTSRSTISSSTPIRTEPTRTNNEPASSDRGNGDSRPTTKSANITITGASTEVNVTPTQQPKNGYRQNGGAAQSANSAPPCSNGGATQRTTSDATRGTAASGLWQQTNGGATQRSNSGITQSTATQGQTQRTKGGATKGETKKDLRVLTTSIESCLEYHRKCNYHPGTMLFKTYGVLTSAPESPDADVMARRGCRHFLSFDLYDRRCQVYLRCYFMESERRLPDIAVGQTYTVVGHFLKEDEIGDFKVLTINSAPTDNGVRQNLFNYVDHKMRASLLAEQR